jgi:fluoride ion exporter CrcB/FEX
MCFDCRAIVSLRFHRRELVLIGVLGGFTTYSTFGLDTYLPARSQPGNRLKLYPPRVESRTTSDERPCAT